MISHLAIWMAAFGLATGWIFAESLRKTDFRVHETTTYVLGLFTLAAVLSLGIFLGKP